MVAPHVRALAALPATGLIDGYCTLNSQWSSCCALRLAVLPCSLGLLRVPHSGPSGLRFAKSYGFSRAQGSNFCSGNGFPPRRIAVLPPQFSMVAHCARKLACELPASLGSSYRLRFAGPVFRGCGLRASPPSPLGLRGNGLFRALRAAFVRPRRTRRRGRLKRERASFLNSFFPSRLRYAYWYFVSSAWYSGHFS